MYMAHELDASKAPEMPVLTLDPFGEGAKAEVAPTAPPPAEPAVLDEDTLSPEEREMVASFSQTIDITNTNVVLQYGAAAQQKVSGFSETALQNVRTKDLGEVGDMMVHLIGELKGFSTEPEERGFLGIFKRTANKITALKARYDKAEANVEKICTALEQHQVTLMKDVAMLDQMYTLNLTYFKELSMYILAGKQKLEEVRATDLPQLVEKAKQSGLPEDAQAANDLENLCNRFEKKIHDLELTRMISIQMAPQIRLVQGNDALMTEKIQSTLVNNIPLWKSQMVLALGLAHSQQAMEAQRQVTDMTNELLRRNADTLKTATLETARESERGVVDIETLQHTNEQLISTLDEVLRIQAEGKEKRRQAEAELGRIEGELKQKLLEVRE